MSNKDDRLIDLATALSDGVPIDWDAAESSAVTDSERWQIRRLRLVRDVTDSPLSSAWVAGQGQDVHDSLLHPAGLYAGQDSQPVTWGPLTVIEKLGRGRFGDVYRARDPRLDRDVALKLLRHRSDDGGMESLVIHEGRLLAKIRHPNVVTVYGAERIGDRVGVWMHLVRGVTLEDELVRRGPFPPDEVAAIGIEVCRALGAVHAAGLVHRDVKGQNVMRDEDGRLVLMDFGTGRECDADGPAELAGTPLYLAPEVIEGHVATPQSDLYSLGVLLFHLATGAYPVNGRSLREIQQAHHSRTRDVSRALGEMPRSFVGLVQRSVAFDPAARFQNAAEMEAALNGAVPRPLSRRRLRELAVAAIIAVSLPLVTCTVAGWNRAPFVLWALRNQPRSPAPFVRTASGRGGPTVDAWSVGTSDVAINDISRDGRRAVGVSPDSRMVVVRDLVTGVDTPLPETTSVNPPESVLSSDGTSVAVRLSRQRGSGAELTLIDISTRRPRVLMPARPLRGIKPLAWAPDGGAILAELRHRDGSQEPWTTTELVWIPTGGGEPYVIKTFDRKSAPQNIQLSPDGTTIAYSRAESASTTDKRIFLLDRDGRVETGVVRMAGSNTDPVWASDGRALVFISDRSGGRALWTIPIASGQAAGQASMLMPGFIGRPIRFATTGILYCAVALDEGGHVQAVVERDPKGRARVMQAFAGQAGQWSPDGKWIAFYRLRPGGNDLIVRALDGGEERSFPGHAFTNKPPRWVPHADSLLVNIDGGPTEKHIGGSFYRLDRHPGDLTRLFPRDTPAHQRSVVGSFTPDGRTLVLAARATVGPWTDIVHVEVATGRESHVVKLPGAGLLDVGVKNLGLAVNPDGQSLAIMAFSDETRRQSQIVTMDLDGRNYRQIAGPFPAWGTADLMDWTPDGASIVFVSTNPNGDWRVMRVGRYGGAVVPDGLDSTTLTGSVPLPRLARQQPWTIDLSPDGTRLLVSGPTHAVQELWAIGGLVDLLKQR